MEKQNNKGLLSRQKRVICFLAIFVFLLCVAYIVIRLTDTTHTVTLPFVDEVGDRVEYSYAGAKGEKVTVVSRTEETLTLSSEGEITYSARPYIFPEISSEELSSIAVSNTHGLYELYLDSAGEYVFRSNEMLVYNAEKLADLKVQARYMLANVRLEGEYSTEEALSAFGLSDADSPSRVSVTDTNGNTHTILVGSLTLSGDGYYAKDTSKPYVYVLDTGAAVFFEDEKSFFEPWVVPTLTQNEYQYMDAFSITKNGELFMSSAIVPEDVRSSGSDTDLHKLTYPAGYSASLTKYYDALASLGSLKGSRVVETGVLAGGEEHADVLFETYGLSLATNDVSYTSGEKTYRFITGKRFTDTDGTVCYYVYSPYMDTICVLPLENAPFLEYELLDFIDASVFQVNINDIAELEARMAGVSCRFRLEGEGKELVMTNADTGEVVDTASFRQFYIKLLSIKIEGYASMEDVTGNGEFSFSYTTDHGETASYSFDILSTTRSLITLDASSEFYTNRSYITKAAEYLMKLSMGETIAADY